MAKIFKKGCFEALGYRLQTAAKDLKICNISAE
jgi:hypothetical protein